MDLALLYLTDVGLSVQEGNEKEGKRRDTMRRSGGK
jgi:hypothetical protein